MKCGRIWLVLFAFILCLGVASTSRAEDVCGPNLHWSFSDSGILTISGTGEMNVGYSSPWKDNIKAITKIVIEDGVTSISDDAFYNCENVVEVVLPESILDIGKGAFRKCENLVKINIPKGITVIKEKTFDACKSLKDIILPDGLISIEDEAFSECESLESIIIPDSVTSISLVRTFYRCKNLQEFVINENSNYYVDAGVLYSKTKNALLFYPTGKQTATFTIPDGTSQISPYSFYENKYINEITIPGSVNFIGKYAFRYCSSIKNIVIKDGVKILRLGAFEGCTKIPSIYIPSSIELIEEGAFLNCPKLRSFEVSEESSTYKTIDGVLFSKDGTLLVAYPEGRHESSYIVPEGVTTIGSYAFWANKDITYISFPESLETIGKEAFYACRKLNNIVLPQNVYLLDYNSFVSCDELISVTILNFNVEFDKYGVFKYGNKELVIKGLKGSTAETQAAIEGFPFEEITIENEISNESQEWICPECGTKMNGGKFCSECGTKRP